MAAETVDIKGVELAKVGKWAGGDGRGRPAQLDITREDLTAAVAAYEYAMANGGASAAEVPIKVGHVAAQETFGDLADKMADGAPAFGWVGNLRVVGDTLVGDYLRMPAKFAAMVKSGAWRNRSIEFYRNAKWPMGAAGKTFGMVMSAVAVLGATPPAVKGLADIFAASEGDDDAERFFTAAGTDEPPTESEVEKILSEVRDFITAKLEPHFRGRAGAPMARTLFASFEAQIRRAIRFTKPTPQEGQMRTAALAMLGLAEDATNEAALAAIPTLTDEGKTALRYFAALNADAAIAVMCEILGIPGGTPDDVIAKLRELTGGDPAADPNAPGGDVPPAPGGGTMSNVNGAATAAEVAALHKELADLKGAHALHLAETRVARDIEAHSLLATARPNLLYLALHGEDALYASAIQTTAKVPTGEKGTAAGIDAPVVTDNVFAAAGLMGIGREDAVKLFGPTKEA